jgi:hypothetical protein
MDQTLTHDTLAITFTAGWMSYEEFAEEYYETTIPYTRPTPVVIPEHELPY